MNSLTGNWSERRAPKASQQTREENQLQLQLEHPSVFSAGMLQ